jgi:hypothetical protein
MITYIYYFYFTYIKILNLTIIEYLYIRKISKK